jgi:hypothetical protein
MHDLHCQSAKVIVPTIITNQYSAFIKAHISRILDLTKPSPTLESGHPSNLELTCLASSHLLTNSVGISHIMIVNKGHLSSTLDNSQITPSSHEHNDPKNTFFYVTKSAWIFIMWTVLYIYIVIITCKEGGLLWPCTIHTCIIHRITPDTLGYQ